MSEHNTIEATLESDRIDARELVQERWALVLAWSRDEPERIGEVLLVPGAGVLGRGPSRPDDPEPRLELWRQRPDQVERRPPLRSPRLSRLQLIVRPRADGLDVENVGRRSLCISGVRAERAVARAGDTVRVGDELVLVVSRRPPVLPPLRSYRRDLEFEFGQPDADGLVGESPAAWRLRDELAFAARADAHVLLSGSSGAGKELAARAIHRLSSRSAGALVSRNAATFPEGLIDAELFGNIKNYPNPGTPEREGLIGGADGGTLFLDEIGELPQSLQAHLLRVLDRGEYQRLGEAGVRSADLRVVAATNRAAGELKHDFAARLKMRVHVPDLSERRDDIPLLIATLLDRLAASHADVDPQATSIDAELVDELVRFDYRLQVRELERILWRALAESSGGRLGLTRGVRELLAPSPAADDGEPATPAPEPSREAIESALADAGGSVSVAARALGLKNRFALYRLLKKHGLRDP